MCTLVTSLEIFARYWHWWCVACGPHQTCVKMRVANFMLPLRGVDDSKSVWNSPATEDRSGQDGLKRANPESKPWDLTEDFVKNLEWLMLAQAQECVWLHVVTDRYKNSLIAKLAAKVFSSLYNNSLLLIRLAAADSRGALPAVSMILSQGFHMGSHMGEQSWIFHLETKQNHFIAASQYRKSIDELEASRKTSSVLRDNDLIYHQDIPAPSGISVIQVYMVQSIVSPGLQDPRSIIGNESIIFGEMLGWGAREAINIYSVNKGNLLKEKIIEPAQNFNDEAEKILQSLYLPSSLEALERPVGLPPSLLRKAEEIRLEQGPTKIDVYLDDRSFRGRSCAQREPVNRPPSHEANQELVMKQQRYRTILTQAAESDELVRRKWEEWEDQITELTRDEDELEALVPSSTVSMTGRAVSTSQTQIHARTLRGSLESLDDILRTRDDIVLRAQRRAESDDIRPKVLVAAAKLEQEKEMSPAMFEEISDDELAKYDNFIQGLTGGRKKQEILASIKSTTEAFIQSRKQDPAVKD
ncbi:BRO1-domain-containing protein [Rhizopogon salebrosus TDB-379]|nr:BRO1-domain-containing protein [Rhizopogon salebrosus TDB-379]